MHRRRTPIIQGGYCASRYTSIKVLLPSLLAVLPKLGGSIRPDRFSDVLSLSQVSPVNIGKPSGTILSQRLDANEDCLSGRTWSSSASNRKVSRWTTPRLSLVIKTSVINLQGCLTRVRSPTRLSLPSHHSTILSLTTLLPLHSGYSSPLTSFRFLRHILDQGILSSRHRPISCQRVFQHVTGHERQYQRSSVLCDQFARSLSIFRVV